MGTISVAPIRRGRDLNERLAQELRALQARYDLTQGDLGSALGVTQSQMSKRLRGHVPFTLAEVEQLAAIFGMTAMELLEQAEAPSPRGPGASGGALPRLDSNQQPSGYAYPPLSAVAA